MFQSLVITLREGVEAALVVGIVLGYLKKTGRERWNQFVYWGILVAVLGSLVAAYFVHRLGVAEEAYEGWLMLTGAGFLTSMVIWMWRTGKKLKQEIETKISTLSLKPSRAAALGIFLFVFLMVFREGIETVLFLAAVSLRTSELLNFMGGIIGLVLAIVLGVAFFKGSLKVNLRKFFGITSLVLGVVAAQLVIAGIHELSEAQIIPSGPREMALIGPLVNNDAYFFVVVVALGLFLIVTERIKAGEASPKTVAQWSAPERRKALAEQQRERFWKTVATAASLLVIVFILGQFIYSRRAHAMSAPDPVTIVNGEARIPVARLGDRNLHRYVVPVGGVHVRLIALLDASDTVRAALDACLICGHQGYYQDGKHVICRNCAAAIYVPTIGQGGGCNPIHVDYLVEGDSIILSESALAAGAKYFR